MLSLATLPSLAFLLLRAKQRGTQSPLQTTKASGPSCEWAHTELVF
ncbi:hypothetical protein VP242E401_P0036 [Vibrio phage 242E40-1]|nr:hypothetical protein VP242E401_P0036 [Vibrio phage 242E40-1]